MNIGIYEFRNGFTLIEILVVMSVIVTIALISGNIFYSTLRTSSKTQVSTNLKQEGGYALTVMERMIRESKEITNCQSDQITVVYKDDEETTFVCDTTLPFPDQVASDSANYSVLIDSIDCDNFSFSCNQPQIGINFTLSKNPSNPLPFSKSGVEFQTSVTARNL